MHIKIATTATVFALAGAATAAAVLFAQSRGADDRAPMPPPPELGACGVSGPAHANAKLAHGTFGANLSTSAVLRGSGGDIAAEFALTVDRVADLQRPPLDLAFVIDHSGSMSDGRLDHAKSAARGIVDHLTAQDHIALIEFDDQADVVLASLAMDGAGKEKIRHAIDGINLGGGTNLHGGLVLGRDEVQRAYVAGEVSRVILLSDGRANEGVVDPHQIAETARDAANRGVRITTVGIGLDFNEDLMEAIAEAGRGNYHYVKEAHDLDQVIASELAGVQATVATSVELRLRPACAGAQIVAVHGYESRRDRESVIVPMADLFGGDSRKLLVSLRVPAGATGKVGAVHAELVYRDAKGGELQSRALDLGVEVTADANVATAAVDQDVMAQVLQLQAADSMRQAAQAYDRGDTAGAQQILESTSREIDKKGSFYKIHPGKTAGFKKELDVMSKGAAAYAPTSDQGKDMIKLSKQKARVMSK